MSMRTVKGLNPRTDSQSCNVWNERNQRRRKALLLTTVKTREKWHICCSIAIESETKIQEVHIPAAYFRCLDVFYTRSRLIISRLKSIGSCRVSIVECEECLTEKCVFEIISRCLYMIQICIPLRGDNSIEIISQDHEVFDRSGRNIRRYKCPDDRAIPWSGEIMLVC